VPVGGLTLWEASTELRIRITDMFSTAVFCDASDVSNQRMNIRLAYLHLSCGVADDLPIQSWEPVGACALDVLVIRNAQNVRAAECVPSARRAKRRRYVRCPVVWRPAGLDVIGCRNPGPETPCGADGYQRSDHCD